jgi:hypothetical protein
MKDNQNRRMYGGRMMTEEQIERRRSKQRSYEKKNKAIRAPYHEKYREDNKESIRDKSSKRYHGDSERFKSWQREYYQKNREEIISKSYEYYKWRKRVDPIFKMTCCMRSRVRNAIMLNKGTKSDKTFELVGCTADELKSQLEGQFTTGMTWDNYGEWHVDHIKPCAKFDLTLDSEQRACFNHTNLQPLWAEDNLKKADKYYER